MLSVGARAPQMAAPRLLFIPVSAERGVGEYARAKEIAIAVRARCPPAEIHFVLNRNAPYATNVPFPTTWLPSSATFHPHAVAQIIREYQPTLVIFDNAGRTPQLKAARGVGARIIFISSRSRQRRRAFRLKWMRLIDEHWIAYPEFVAGSLTRLEQFKLGLLGRPFVRFMDTVMPEMSVLESQSVLTRFGLKPNAYLLVVPGGGTGHPGAENGPQVMADAAAALARQGHRTVFVGAAKPSFHSPLFQHAQRLPMDELAALMSQAQVVITNGGDTLLQVLANARSCVAAAIARDQVLRIKRCQAAGIVVGSSLDASALERATLSLLRDESRRRFQLDSLKRLQITNGIGTAVDAISTLSAA